VPTIIRNLLILIFEILNILTRNFGFDVDGKTDK
jgi:hypothetical protein